MPIHWRERSKIRTRTEWRRLPRAGSLAASLAITLLPVLPGCGGGTEGAPEDRGGDVVSIGVLAALGELAAVSGEPTIEAARLAADEINEAGGVRVDGTARPLAIVVRTHEDRAEAAAGAARALINQDRVHAIVGPQLSRHAIPVANVAEQAQIPMISPMSSNPETTRGKRYVFRLAFLDQVQGAVLARFAREDLGAARAAVLYDVARTYSRDLAELFRAEFEVQGGRVVALETFTTDAVVDFREHLLRIRAGDPDVLLLPNFTAQDSVQARQAREVGIDAVLLGGDTWDLQVMRGVPAAEGAYVTHQWSLDFPGEAPGRFIEAYEKAFGDAPRATAAMTYDALHVLATAMDRAGTTDPDAVRNAVAAFDDFVGVTGAVSYRGTGDPVRSVAISRIQDGRIVFNSVREPRF